MKNNLLIIFMILLIIPFVSSVEIDMKTDFSQGETLIAKVSGNFYQTLTAENIVFKRGHVRTSIVPYVAKINNDFYIYAQLLGKTPDDYSLIIQNAKYVEGSKIIQDDVIKTFSIKQDIADFTVNPGFVSTNKDFFLEIRNLKNSGIYVDLDFSSQSTSKGGFFDSLFGKDSSKDNNKGFIFLGSGETKKVNFGIETFEKFAIIEFSTKNLFYKIPVYNSFKQLQPLQNQSQEPKASNNQTQNQSETSGQSQSSNTSQNPEISETQTQNSTATQNQSQQSNNSSKIILKRGFRFEESKIDFTFSTYSEASKKLHVKNIGNITIENIEFVVSNSLLPYITFSETKIDKLEENSSKTIEVYFYSQEHEIVEGQILAVSGEKVASIPVVLIFLDDFVPVSSDNDDSFSFFSDEENFIDNEAETEVKSCSALNGEICSSNMKCDGDVNYTNDGVCCLSSCELIQESYLGKYIGWGIIFFILILLIWFYIKRFKKVKSVPDIMNIRRR